MANIKIYIEISGLLDYYLKIHNISNIVMDLILDGYYNPDNCQVTCPNCKANYNYIHDYPYFEILSIKFLKFPKYNFTEAPIGFIPNKTIKSMLENKLVVPILPKRKYKHLYDAKNNYVYIDKKIKGKMWSVHPILSSPKEFKESVILEKKRIKDVGIEINKRYEGYELSRLFPMPNLDEDDYDDVNNGYAEVRNERVNNLPYIRTLSYKFSSENMEYYSCKMNIVKIRVIP